MQKFGRVLLKDVNQEYYLVWYEDGVDFERIDVIEDLAQYNQVDTSNCVAAYFRKRRESIYGDDELIKRIKGVRTTLSTLRSKHEQNVVCKDDGVYIITTNKDDSIGMRYEQVLKNALLDSEYFETPDTLIEISEVSQIKGMNIEPINIDVYDSYSILSGVRDLVTTGDAEYYSLEYLKAKYPLDHIEDNDYVVIGSMEEAKARLKRFKDAPTKLKAVDLETTGVGIGMYGSDCITGIVLSYSETESTYYPFRQEKFDYNLPISFLGEILDVVNNQPKDVMILAHNAKFEIQGVWKEYADYIKNAPIAEQFDPDYLNNALKKTYLRIDIDTFILSVLIDSRMLRGLHALKTITQRATGLFYLELDNVFKDKNNIKFNVLPKELVRYYACPDTANTIKVYKYLITKLPMDSWNLFMEVENRLIYVTAENEFYGLNSDASRIQKSFENEQYKVDMLTNEFKKIHNIHANINSPDVRRDIFYSKLRCPVEVYTDKHLPSTSAVALQRIVNLGTLKEYDTENLPPPYKDLRGKVIIEGKALRANRFPTMVMLNTITKSNKELGAFKRLIRTSIKGRIQFGINQVGAATGRRTSNAHQYSDSMKACVVADSKHHYLWSADFKQIELRVLAFLARQLDLIKLESDQDIDIHRAILSIIKGIPMWKISAKDRKKGKSVNFGVVYMMSEYGLAQSAKGPAYTKEDLVEALESITSFYNGLPQIKQFVADNEEQIRSHGYIKTRFGRYRYFREILDPTLPEDKKKSMVRAGNNTPVQGFAADYMKMVEVNLHDCIVRNGWDEKVNCDGVMLPLVRLMLSIHDEVLVSSHESIPIEEVIIMFKDCMEIPIKGAPPFFAAPAMVNNWADGKEDKYEIPLGLRDEVIKAWKEEKRSIIHVETYLEDLNRYRNSRLKSYMDDLISKYQTAEEVTKHVQHDDLTHVLISALIDESKHPGDDKLTHEESIAMAVKRYMESDAIDLEAIVSDAPEELSLRQIALEDSGSLEDYIQFDENGEAVIEEDDDDEVDDTSSIKEYRPPSFDIVERSYATYMLNQVWLDLVDFDWDDAEKIHQEVGKISDPSKSYTVYYMLKGFKEPQCGQIKIDYVPESINEICKKFEREVA